MSENLKKTIIIAVISALFGVGGTLLGMPNLKSEFCGPAPASKAK